MNRLSFVITFAMCFVIMFAMGLFNQAYSHNTPKDSGWTVEEHLSPGDANEDPTTMNVDHTHREGKAGNQDSFIRISRWYRDFHWHALVHSHDGLEEHQHNVEHDDHENDADEGVSLPLSTYHAPDYDTAHEGVGPATNTDDIKIRHYHSKPQYHSDGSHGHSGWHAHPYGNSTHDHHHGPEDFLHSLENGNTSPSFTMTSTNFSVNVVFPGGIDTLVNGPSITATDPDGDTLTYSENSDDFSIDSSRQLRTATEFRSSRTLTVRLTVSDGRGGSDYIDVTVSIISTPATGQQQLASVEPDPNLVNQPDVIFREGTPPQTSNAQAALPEDVDSDGDVDSDDLLDIALHFGKTPEGDLARYDLDGDGDIDVDDFQLVQAQMTKRAPGAPAAIHTLADTLAHIKGLDIADPKLQPVVELLENRLAELAPVETVLLANYPNPFNPETWIPYRLAKPADVTLTIYAINGQAVRTLPVGHQPMGSYINRARAVYWNGKNARGEPVTSGVYFYHLSAGDYSATRRMLILK